MSLNLLKYIGLGILGLGGVSSVAALSSSRVRKFVGISSVISQSSPSTPSVTPDVGVSVLSEEDRQGQFLYKLSKSYFDAFKSNSNSELYTDSAKDNVVKGLKDKFNGSLENEEDTGENFKSLCEAQRKKETKSGKNVDNVYSRFCFIDHVEQEAQKHNSVKGFLWNLYSEDVSTNPFPQQGVAFQDLSKDNFELGTLFKNKYPNANPVDKFDEGLNLTEEEPTSLRNSIKVAKEGQSVGAVVS